MLIQLIILQFIIVFVIDLSGAITSLKLFISKKITNNKITTNNFHLKPFDCSLCMTFWTGLIYLLLTSHLTIPLIGFVCLLSFLTPVTSNIMLTIKDILNKIIDYVYNKVIN